MVNKNVIIATIVVVAVVVIAAGTYIATKSDDKGSDEECYGIVGAMEEEVEDLLEALDETGSETIGDIEFHLGTLAGKKVVVAECGYGKVNAGICTQLMITEFGATAIINSGVAGTLDERVGIGDIVISTETVQHDYDMHEIGFERGLIPNIGTISIKADDKLRESAAQAISTTTIGIQVFQGRVCTGDQFISGKEEMEDITKVFGGMCCEMEGGAIAQVCYTNKVPFVIIRAISDDIDGDGPEDYEKFEKQMAKICALMTIRMMETL